MGTFKVRPKGRPLIEVIAEAGEEISAELHEALDLDDDLTVRFDMTPVGGLLNGEDVQEAKLDGAHLETPEERTARLVAEAVAAARTPLPPEWVDDPPVRQEALDDAVDALTAAGGLDMSNDAVRFAVEAVAASHKVTADAILTLLASAAGTTAAGTARSDLLTLTAMGVLQRFAARPEPTPAPAPDVHVHLPQQDVAVNVAAPHFDPRIEVNVPEQPAPVVHVAAAEAPRVEVNVPAQVTPDVHVHVPEQAAPPPPVVNVQMPAQKPRTVRVVEDPETGERVFVTDTDDAQDD